MATPTIAVFAKWPTPGRAKTRLIPALGRQGAARLHAALVEHTLAVVRDSGLPFTLRTTGAPPEDFAAWLGLPDAAIDQGDGDLGARLARVPAPSLLIGSDAPDLSVAHLHAAADALSRCAAVIGPAADGGYWLLGLARPMSHLFASMPWSTETVATETIARLAADGIDPVILPTLHDCDRPIDLPRWPHLVARAGERTEW